MWKMQEHFSAKEKESKENRSMPLASCVLAFLSGFAKRDFLSLWQSATLVPRPFGLFRIKHTCLARHTGVGVYFEVINLLYN